MSGEDPGGCRAPAREIEELKAAAQRDFRKLA
jgi:hypothetical protein